MADTMTKKELQALVEDIGERVSNMLDPVLTREEIVEQMKELDAVVNGSDDEEDEEDDDPDEDEDDIGE
jgi:hypothetical protein